MRNQIARLLAICSFGEVAGLFADDEDMDDGGQPSGEDAMVSALTEAGVDEQAARGTAKAMYGLNKSSSLMELYGRSIHALV